MAVLKIARFWPSSRRGTETTAAGDLRNLPSDGLDAFGSEAAVAAAAPAAINSAAAAPAPIAGARLTRRSRWTAVTAFAVIVATAAGIYIYRKHPFARLSTGAVTIETAPAGVDVFVAGKNVGKSPVTLALAAGAYEVRLGTGEQARQLKVDVVGGASVVQHYELPAVAAVPPATEGTLDIQTEPARLTVLLDGVEKGTSPVRVEHVAAGDHEIAVRAEQGLVKRQVHIAGGEAASVLVASAAPKADGTVVTAGYVSIASAIPLDVKEGGHLLGTSEVDRLMLSSGDHDLELVNDGLGFRAQRKVKVVAGKTVSTRIEVPNGTMSLNAMPWAEVFVDGERIGETPIGNLSRPIGRHDVLFRHPQLGERHETIVVTAQQVARLGVDLRKK